MDREQLGSGLRLRPRHPQHRMAVANDLGHLAERLGRLPEVHPRARRAPARERREDHRHQGRGHPARGRADRKAEGRRQPPEDLVHAREGQLLVEQLHEHHVPRGARAHLRLGKSSRPHALARRRSPARDDESGRRLRMAQSRKVPGAAQEVVQSGPLDDRRQPEVRVGVRDHVVRGDDGEPGTAGCGVPDDAQQPAPDKQSRSQRDLRDAEEARRLRRHDLRRLGHLPRRTAQHADRGHRAAGCHLGRGGLHALQFRAAPAPLREVLRSARRGETGLVGRGEVRAEDGLPGLRLEGFERDLRGSRAPTGRGRSRPSWSRRAITGRTTT